MRIQVSLTRDGVQAVDAVTLGSAPLLTHHHLQATQRLVVSTVPGKYWRSSRRSLASATRAAGLGDPQGLPTADPWSQDFLEPGYLSMPAPGGTQSMRLLIRSDQPRPSSRSAYALRGPDVGVLWLGRIPRRGPLREHGSLSSFGNLETIPPYSHDGESFPAGRIVLGRSKSRRPDGNRPSDRLVEMLRAQGIQSPLYLDVSFLAVGHVDEMIQFVPADTPRGWRLAIASPRLGLDLLRQARAAGKSDRPISQGTGGPTVKEALRPGPRGLVRANLRAARVIDRNRDTLAAATGLAEEEIVEIPALFAPTAPLRRTEPPRGTPGVTTASSAALGPGRTRSPRAAARPVARFQVAAVPGAINGVVLDADDVLVPRQTGPRIQGRDLFAAAVEEAYAGAGMRVHWIDTRRTYHRGGGEIHCGTNALRGSTGRWW